MPPTLYDEREKALADGKAICEAECPGEPFLLQGVVQAKLRDFFLPHVLIGDMRERMQEMLHDDTPMDATHPEGGSVFDGEFAECIAQALDAFEAQINERGLLPLLDGKMRVVSQQVIYPDAP